MGLESRIINSDNFRIMNIKKVGVAIEYCTYDKMKAKNEVSQGWSEWGDLAFLSKEKDIETFFRESVMEVKEDSMLFDRYSKI